jgi:hypothetical protein
MTAKIRPTITPAPRSRKKASAAPLPPACTFPRIASLARWELREHIDAYLSAKECQANALERAASLDPVKDAAEIALTQAFGERAEMTADLARTAIAELLLLSWGIAHDYDHASGNEPTPPWTPIGCHVDDFVAWIKPGDVEAEVRYNATHAEFTVVALEDLSDYEAEDHLLESPPAPLLRLHYRDATRVIPAGAPA